MNGCSVVIPVHNEAAHIEDFLAVFRSALGGYRDRVGEVLLIENGSTDGTFEAAGRAAGAWPGVVRVLRVERASYGAAIKHGILEAAGSVVSVLECDVLDAGFLERSAALVGSGEADLVVASKRHPESVDRRPLKRRLLTRLYNMFLHLALKFPGTDTHGLKTFRGSAAKELCRLSRTSDEVLQTELVLLAYRLGYKVRELPLALTERRAAPISVLRRLPKVLRTIRELRRSLRRFPEAPAR